jgi:hypothetical protein
VISQKKTARLSGPENRAALLEYADILIGSF